MRRWSWLLVIAGFALCLALKLHGSSIGAWQELLHEPEPIRGLLLFKPEQIRGDEWALVTPSIMNQARHSPPFPVQNDNIGGGYAPLLMSVPVAYYTTLFRPQLWGFFILDFERAFSFYWCGKIFALILAFAWLLRQIGIERRSVVVFGAIWIFFSSFVQWWFSTPAMLPEMIASWAMMTGCALKFFKTASSWGHALAVVGFVFFGVNFALCMYPGFQVPLLYVSVAILISIFWQRRTTDEWRATRGLVLLAAALALFILVLVPFWWTVRDTLRIVAQTDYPGVYRNSGGGLHLFDLFSGVLGFLESENRTPFQYDNICEASNFYPLSALVLPIAVFAAWRKRIPLPPLLVGLTAVILALGIYCIVPMPAAIAHASFLGLTTESRLLLGIGLANILLSCVFLDRYRETILSRSGIIAAIAVVVWIAVGLKFLTPYSEKWLNISIVAFNALILGIFLWERARRWFMPVFAALVIFNGAGINPIMSGLSALTESNAFRKIDKLHAADPSARWIGYEDANLAQLVKATGASVLNGTKIVPDFPLMREFDPEGRSKSIYNRYAYIAIGLPNESSEIVFDLMNFGGYQFTLPPSLPFLRTNGYRYAVFPRKWLNANLHGFSLVEEIPASEVYIYKRVTGQD